MAWAPGQKLPIRGLDSDALFLLVRSLYTGSCPLGLELVVQLHDAAFKLQVV